jgi:hypothetical protein
MSGKQELFFPLSFHALVLNGNFVVRSPPEA